MIARQLTRRLGPDAPALASQTFQAYGQLLTERSHLIQSTKRATYSYGLLPRQELDVYSPKQHLSTERSSHVLVFLYGGGFVEGDKILTNQQEVYSNVGYFFANECGIETVVIDYRLLSHGARYPSGGCDLEAALRWVNDHYSQSNIFLLGTSAGAIHIATFLFDARFKSWRDQLLTGVSNRLVGAVLMSIRADSRHSSPMMAQRNQDYCGEGESDKQALALLRKAKHDKTIKLPSILVTESEFDLGVVQAHMKSFVDELQEGISSAIDYALILGHNHFSPVLALGTGIEEEESWVFDMVTWMQRVV